MMIPTRFLGRFYTRRLVRLDNMLYFCTHTKRYYYAKKTKWNEF